MAMITTPEPYLNNVDCSEGEQSESESVAHLSRIVARRFVHRMTPIQETFFVTYMVNPLKPLQVGRVPATEEYTTSPDK